VFFKVVTNPTTVASEDFARCLTQSGINPDHLHLNAGSLDWYQLPEES
jgi:hypothetical protein